ncbi:aminotransferase class I/II-fold pyridoxal phosphate-dependent enzyme [Nostocoides sp. F2B08]|uniref:MalY/PatB family protein n=1 Tax=Nostocoides sp. F2B08 TaxID=2653936 RepID=UPI00126381E4|nr:aminotransferase class I/II-fold pyridoxal phosphate-dependent enzyme [Tetrasphaera sp. F2B08]KAB7743020.1 aminotransferase class I/II-fold pyridoxal phosphate-dependent enzyme [Tetrasphaera sp. F2B08]
MRILGADLATNRLRTSVKWRAFPRDVLPLWVAEMDAVLAPPVVAEVTALIARGDTGYAWPEPYVESFAAFADHRWQWSVDSADVRVVADVMVGMEELTRILLPDGGRVIVDDPVYDAFALHAAAILRDLGQVPLTAANRLDLDALEAAFATSARDGVPSVYWLCNPQNPTGTVPTRAELEELRDVAARHDVRVLSDEIHAPLCIDDDAFTPYLSVDPRGLTATSPSKAFNLAGLKAGLVTAGPEARDVLGRLHPVVSYAASHVAVRAHTAAYRDGGPWLDEVRGELSENRALVRRLLDTRLPQVRWAAPQATYLAWLDVGGLGLGSRPAHTLVSTARVALGEGTNYGPSGVGHVRLNLATSPGILTEAVDRITGALEARTG